MQETDIPLELYTTSCKRACPEEFHSAGKERALAEVASLYEYVQKMPDGPQKTHFLKRVSGSLGLSWRVGPTLQVFVSPCSLSQVGGPLAPHFRTSSNQNHTETR